MKDNIYSIICQYLVGGRGLLRLRYRIDLSRKGVFVAFIGQGMSPRSCRCNICLEQCVQYTTRVDMVE